MKKTLFKKLIYIGGCVFEGQSIDGVEQTPVILRNSGLFTSLKKKFGVEVIDYGDVSKDTVKVKQSNILDDLYDRDPVQNLKILDPMLKQINDKVGAALKQHPDSFILTVGGDHSVATGSIHALNKYYKNLKIIWVDAHPDLILTSASRYSGYHGYPLAHLTGLSSFPGFEWLVKRVPYENIVYVAIRDIDIGQWNTIKKYNIKSFTMDHVQKYGISQVVNQAVNYLDKEGTSPFHISFDIDALDPQFVPGTATKFRGGLSHRQACYLIRDIAHQRNLVSMDLTEINSSLQLNITRQREIGESQIGSLTPTLVLATALIKSVFTRYLQL